MNLSSVKYVSLAVLLAGMAIAVPADAASKRTAKPANAVTTYCPDTPWRCDHYITGVCKGTIYTDVYGDKRCVPNRNGKRGVRFLPSWGTRD